MTEAQRRFITSQSYRPRKVMLGGEEFLSEYESSWVTRTLSFLIWSPNLTKCCAILCRCSQTQKLIGLLGWSSFLPSYLGGKGYNINMKKFDPCVVLNPSRAMFPFE